MEKLTYRLRVRLLRGEPFFGPGVFELLQRTRQTGSLHTAAAQMKMSYSKAWRIMKTAEQALGFALTTRRIGGAGGGSSQLTERGCDFIKRYVAFEEALQQEAEVQFQRYFADLILDGGKKNEAN